MPLTSRLTTPLIGRKLVILLLCLDLRPGGVSGPPPNSHSAFGVDPEWLRRLSAGDFDSLRSPPSSAVSSSADHVDTSVAQNNQIPLPCRLGLQRGSVKSGSSAVATTSSNESNIRRARVRAEDGQLSKAVAALTSKGLATPSDATVAAMLSLHPNADPPTPPNFSEGMPRPFHHSFETVIEAAKNFPKGSAAGASGFRPQVFRDVVTCPNKSFATRAGLSLTAIVNHMSAGAAPRYMARYLSGAPLLALKQGGRRD